MAGNGPTLMEWRNGLLGVNDTLADQLIEETDPYATLHSLHLPVPSYIGFATVNSFMERPEEHLERMAGKGIINHYVGLRTDVPGWDKFRTPGPIVRDGVVPYITQNLSPERYDNYALRIAEYIVAEAGITAIINRGFEGEPGAMHLDIIRGDLGPLATGYATPDYSAQTDRHGILRYYEKGDSQYLTGSITDSHFLNTSMRRGIWRGLQSIPTEYADSTMRKQRLPGYYEFAVVNHGGVLVPLFVDAKPSSKANTIFSVPETQ